ncbi:MAG: hypothetical protein KBC41_02535 [Candidatus Pacebacteria bacterium]|nr:hypothetical protein [Candidatus Paceibacterota bacterium]
MDSKQAIKGKKVRCINATFKDDSHFPFTMKQLVLPKRGSVYTIRDVEKGSDNERGIRLEEIVNEKFPFTAVGMKEPMFLLQRFTAL